MISKYNFAFISYINHAIYAVLFIIRSIYFDENIHPSSQHQMFYESIFLGWIIPPGMQQLFGWAEPYQNTIVLNLIDNINCDYELGSIIYGSWIARNSTNLLYWYQVAEGIFHIMICIGSYLVIFNKNNNFNFLFPAGLWLEFLIMDIPYTICFTRLWYFFDFPGYYGLMSYICFLHHVTVIPDVVSLYFEIVHKYYQKVIKEH